MKTKKSLGQHWLINPKISEVMSSYCEQDKSDIWIEIGPGLGALTIHLLAKCSHIFLIEKDTSIIKQLEKNLEAYIGKFTIINEDILEFNYNVLAKDRNKSLVIYGNLPYNIATAILTNLNLINHLVKNVTIMLQKEVAQRIIAKPGRHSSRLSIVSQLYFRGQVVLDVSADNFFPTPKVNSQIIYLEPRYDLIAQINCFETFKSILFKAFTQRRKKLRNSLVYEEDNLLDVYLQKRPEELSVEDFITLSNFLFKGGTIHTEGTTNT